MQLVTFLTRICSTVSNGHKPSPFKPIYPSLSCDKYVSAQKNLLCTCCCIHIHIHLKFPLQFLIVLRVHFLLSVWLLPPHRPTQFPQLLSISTLSDSISSFSGSTNGIGGTPNILSESCRSSAYRVFMLRKRPSALGPFHPTHSNHRSPYGLKATLYFLQSILILPSYFLSRKNLLVII